MKKVLATLLIATVGLTSLLANGISEGVINTSPAMAQDVDSTTADDSLEVNEDLTANGTTINEYGRGSRAPRSSVGNKSSNIQRHNGGRMGSNTNVARYSNQANGNMRNSTTRIEYRNQHMNQQMYLADDCIQLDNELNNQNYFGRNNRGSNMTQQQYSTKGNVGNYAERRVNLSNNNQSMNYFTKTTQRGMRANATGDMQRAGSQSQRYDDCTNLDGTTPREYPRNQINNQDIDD